MLHATNLFSNTAILPFSAMQQATHPLTSSGLKTETILFYIKETTLSLETSQEITTANVTSALHRTMLLKMSIQLLMLLCYVNIKRIPLYSSNIPGLTPLTLFLGRMVGGRAVY